MEHKKYNNNNYQNQEEEESSFNILEWVFKFLYKWYYLAGGLIIGTAIAFFINQSWIPSYQSEAKILIDGSKSSNYSFMQGFSSGEDNREMSNQILILTSFDQIRKTIEQMPKLKVDFINKGRFKVRNLYEVPPLAIDEVYLSDEAYSYTFKFTQINETDYTITNEKETINFKGKFGEPLENKLMFITISNISSTIGRETYFKFRSINSLESEFVGRLYANYLGKSSSVITLSLTSQTPARDMDFLNKHAEVFQQSNLEKKNAEAARTISFIDQQISFLADSLNVSESQISQFRRENSIVDFQAYSGQISTKMLEFENKKNTIILKESYFNYLSNYLKKGIEDEGLVAPTSLGVSDQSLLSLVSKYNELQMTRSEFGIKNPNYDKYTQQMMIVKNNLYEVLKNVRAVHEIEKAEFDRQYKQTLSELNLLPQKESKILNIERKYKITDNYYTFLLQKKSESEIRQASNTPDNSVLQKARIMSTTNAGQKKKTYTTYCLIGLLIPAAFIFLKDFLNNKIRVPKDIETLCKYKLIASIAHTEDRTPILSVKNPKSLFAESFRLIRTKIEFLTQRKSGITIMISSAESGDGKTYFSANLAGCYSLAYGKTLLIDLDLRKPSHSKLFNQSQTKGLVHHLIGEIGLEEAITSKTEYNFDVLFAGVLPPNPAELISSDKMKEIITTLKKTYDYIIIDTSPLGLVSDAYSIVDLVDVTLIMARSDKTNKNSFKYFCKELAEQEMKNTYVVMNDLDETKLRKLGYGYSYGYGYGYGKRYGYGSYGNKNKDYYTDSHE